MALGPQNINKHSSYNQPSASTQNGGHSKTSKSALLLRQELTKSQSIQPLPNNDFFGLSKDENIMSSNIYNAPLLYSATTDSISNQLKTTIKCTRFPDNFDPRKELNMPHKEKVEKWIVGVPAVPTNELGESWENLCYDPMIPTSDEYEDSDNDSEIDFGGDDDVIAYQSKLITFLVNKDYFNDTENVRKIDGKLIPGGLKYSNYNNHILDYNDPHTIKEYDRYETYNIRR